MCMLLSMLGALLLPLTCMHVRIFAYTVYMCTRVCVVLDLEAINDAYWNSWGSCPVSIVALGVWEIKWIHPSSRPAGSHSHPVLLIKHIGKLKSSLLHILSLPQRYPICLKVRQRFDISNTLYVFSSHHFSLCKCVFLSIPLALVHTYSFYLPVLRLHIGA